MTTNKPALPSWATHSEIALPRGRVPIVHVDAEGAYQTWLRELEVDAVDQYWLEVAYQCIKLELQLSMRGFGFEVRIHDAEKRYRQADYPPGRGARAAARGLEAREHFRRLRGFLPG